MSIVNVDDIPDDDVIEIIDLVSPEKPAIRELGMHHKKKFLKMYLEQNDAVLINVENEKDVNENGAVENDMPFFDGKYIVRFVVSELFLNTVDWMIITDDDLNISIDYLVQQLIDEFELENPGATQAINDAVSTILNNE